VGSSSSQLLVPRSTFPGTSPRAPTPECYPPNFFFPYDAKGPSFEPLLLLPPHCCAPYVHEVRFTSLFCLVLLSPTEDFPMRRSARHRTPLARRYYTLSLLPQPPPGVCWASVTAPPPSQNPTKFCPPPCMTAVLPINPTVFP